MLEIIKDALIDSLKLLPVLMPMYIVIEIVEKRGLKYLIKPLSSKWSVLVAAGVGVIPQCGFSVVATKLYVKKLISLGALVAVFIAVSDEAVPILITQPGKLLPLLAVKIVLAVCAGYSVIAFLRLKGKIAKNNVVGKTNNSPSNVSPHKKLKNADKTDSFAAGLQKNTSVLQSTPVLQGVNGSARSDATYIKDSSAEISDTVTDTVNEANEFCSFGCHNHEIGSCCHEHHNHGFFHRYLLHPIIHAATVFGFVLFFNILFGLIVDALGADRLNIFMMSTGAAQPLLAGLIGLIPNCASSVAIAQMYSIGHLNLGAAVAGLSINAGVSYVILIKESKNRLNSLYIIMFMFVFSVAAGTVIHLIGSLI